MRAGPDEGRLNSSSVKTYLPWLVATALFMEQLDATVVNTAIPSIAVSLGVTPLSLKSVVTSYILGLAVGIPVSGWMADRYGTRRVFLIAIGIFTLASTKHPTPQVKPGATLRPPLSREPPVCTQPEV